MCVITREHFITIKIFPERGVAGRSRAKARPGGAAHAITKTIDIATMQTFITRFSRHSFITTSHARYRVSLI